MGPWQSLISLGSSAVLVILPPCPAGTTGALGLSICLPLPSLLTQAGFCSFPHIKGPRLVASSSQSAPLLPVECLIPDVYSGLPERKFIGKGRTEQQIQQCCRSPQPRKRGDGSHKLGIVLDKLASDLETFIKVFMSFAVSFALCLLCAFDYSFWTNIYNKKS